MIHPSGRETHAGRDARRFFVFFSVIEVEDKITGSLGKSHEKIQCCKTKMEKQRHGL